MRAKAGASEACRVPITRGSSRYLELYIDRQAPQCQGPSKLLPPHCLFPMPVVALCTCPNRRYAPILLDNALPSIVTNKVVYLVLTLGIRRCCHGGKASLVAPLWMGRNQRFDLGRTRLLLADKVCSRRNSLCSLCALHTLVATRAAIPLVAFRLADDGISPREIGQHLSSLMLLELVPTTR